MPETCFKIIEDIVHLSLNCAAWQLKVTQLL